MKKKIGSILEGSGYGTFIPLEDLHEYEKAEGPFITDGLFLLIEGYADVSFNVPSTGKPFFERIYPEDYQLGGFFPDLNEDLLRRGNISFTLGEGSSLCRIHSSRRDPLLGNRDFLRKVSENNFIFFTKKLRENHLRSSMSIEEYIAYYLHTYSLEGSYHVDNITRFSRVLKCDRANLYRTITKLEKKQILKREGKAINILDETLLASCFKSKETPHPCK